MTKEDIKIIIAILAIFVAMIGKISLFFIKNPQQRTETLLWICIMWLVSIANST
jgi:uncharacterized protein YpmB